MAEKNFAMTPTVSINRSKFLRTSTHKTCINLGDIVPVYLDEVLPGDTRSIDLAALVRMSTPIAPIMDDIELEFFAFFVPNRIVWDNWKKFMGENDSAGYVQVTPVTPKMSVSSIALVPGTIGDYFGLGNYGSIVYNVSALPFRGYAAIYNRWFRDQNVAANLFVSKADGSDNLTGIQPGSFCKKAFKKSDYFTRALPYAQKGDPVRLPLGLNAPVKTIPLADVDTSLLSTNPLYWALSAGGVPSVATSSTPQYMVKNTDASQVSAGSHSGTLNPELFPANLVADLSKATAATINQLREAFQLQKLLEHDALYGTRYWEILYGHFSVRSPDATLQDPEYLGGYRMDINVDQVLSTAGYNPNASTTVGAPGANSVTGGKGSLFTKSFVEHGFIHIYAVARQKKHTYSNRLDRMWTREDRYDYYWPEFANLGSQEIKNKEIFVTGTSADDLPFGYQEYAAEYRYKPSQVTSYMNPLQSSSFNFWTLSDRYTSTPTLSSSFLEEDRTNLIDALVSGSSGPDFICDFYFQDTAVRPMPMFSIPGLIDHH